MAFLAMKESENDARLTQELALCPQSFFLRPPPLPESLSASMTAPYSAGLIKYLKLNNVSAVVCIQGLHSTDPCSLLFSRR